MRIFDAVGLCICGLLVLLGIAVAVAWVRSYRTADSFWSNGPGRVNAIVISRGELELYRQRVNSTAPFQVVADRGHRAQAPRAIQLGPSGPSGTSWEHLGFGYAAGTDPYGSRRVVLMPLWALVAAAGLPPVFWLLARRRRRIGRLRRENRCVICGYDLRASPNRCPECGTPVAAAQGSPYTALP